MCTIFCFICPGIDITAPSQQQLIYQSNDTIECSSANNTEAVWYIVNPISNVDTHIESNAIYSVGPEGLHITNVQLYHHQQYRCEHLLQSIHRGRSVIIDVEVLGKQINCFKFDTFNFNNSSSQHDNVGAYERICSERPDAQFIFRLPCHPSAKFYMVY